MRLLVTPSFVRATKTSYPWFSREFLPRFETHRGGLDTNELKLDCHERSKTPKIIEKSNCL